MVQAARFAHSGRAKARPLTKRYAFKENTLSRDNWKELNRLRLKAFSSATHETLQQKYALLLAVRITELCQDSYELINNNRLASTPIIMRSALESYIDLKCILNDASHIKKMNDSFENYKNNTQKKNNIFEKFKSVGEVETYNGLYSHLCRSSHGNIDSLVRDHAFGDAISIGHSSPPLLARQYMNQIIALAATAMIEALSFINYQKDLVLEIQEIQKLAGAGEYA